MSLNLTSAYRSLRSFFYFEIAGGAKGRLPGKDPIYGFVLDFEMVHIDFSHS